jgi:hypothetical protein
LVLAFEGAAAAKTHATELATSHEDSASASQGVSPNAAPATGTAPFAVDDRDFANSALATHIRICHISRHPRDGVPAEEHACPLLIADATQAVIAPATLPSAPSSTPKSERARVD